MNEYGIIEKDMDGNPFKLSKFIMVYSGNDGEFNTNLLVKQNNKYTYNSVLNFFDPLLENGTSFIGGELKGCWVFKFGVQASEYFPRPKLIGHPKNTLFGYELYAPIEGFSITRGYSDNYTAADIYVTVYGLDSNSDGPAPKE